jgi:hypothetical protein
MKGHATPGEFELYVQGALEGARAAFVESHCASCAPCAAGLAREASLEIAFEQIARRVPRPTTEPLRLDGGVVHTWWGRPARAAACGAAGLVAMAAAAVLWLGRSPVGAGEASGAAQVVLGSGGPQASTLDGATFDALHDALDGG